MNPDLLSLPEIVKGHRSQTFKAVSVMPVPVVFFSKGPLDPADRRLIRVIRSASSLYISFLVPIRSTGYRYTSLMHAT